jgi:RHS repeat-associated protein
VVSGEEDSRAGAREELLLLSGFTGKEDDLAVGVTYFGKRYLIPALGRWASADPLAVHVPGSADLNLYAYVHGRLLSATDPTGLTAVENQGAEGAPAAGDGTQPPVEEAPGVAVTPPPAATKSGAEGASSGKTGDSAPSSPQPVVKASPGGARGASGGIGNPLGGPTPAPPVGGGRGAAGATAGDVRKTIADQQGQRAFEAARSAAPNPFVGRSEYLGEPGKILIEGLALEGLVGEMGALDISGERVAASGIRENKSVGDAFSASVGNDLRASGLEVQSEVTIKTASGVRVRMDHLVRPPGGKIECVECKASDTAPLTKNQKVAFPEIARTGAVVVGKGKPGFPGGTRIPPGPVTVVRPKQEPPP